MKKVNIARIYHKMTNGQLLSWILKLKKLKLNDQFLEITTVTFRSGVAKLANKKFCCHLGN